MKVVACLSFFLACATWPALADDDLPNFNAPKDTSPLNVEKVNRALGIELFQDASLWKEDDIFVAKRLEWPEESRTSREASYRLYPTEEGPRKILGARAYSCLLNAAKGYPTEVSIVFVNQGDYAWNRKSSSTPKENPSGDATAADDLSDIDRDQNRAFEKTLKADAQTITDALTSLFGAPAHQGFGGGSETREQVKRWDWQGHAFLLSTPRDTYVALRIVPVAFADNYGKADDVDHDALKALLLQRVARADSGDVVVGDIPMVDQGPKGYCVPATWERYLRFLGIPADMYVLAMAAGSSTNGTDVAAMTENVDSLVTLYHRRIDVIQGEIDLRTIGRNIDQGLPMMWSCTIHKALERAISRRMMDRAAVTDWEAWGKMLADEDTAEIAAEITGDAPLGGHQRMIIGYNARTGEIAISDSWSKAFAIRWMTLREANAINLGMWYVIQP